jgi:hypothetical protein
LPADGSEAALAAQAAVAGAAEQPGVAAVAARAALRNRKHGIAFVARRGDGPVAEHAGQAAHAVRAAVAAISDAIAAAPAVRPHGERTDRLCVGSRGGNGCCRRRGDEGGGGIGLVDAVVGRLQAERAVAGDGDAGRGVIELDVRVVVGDADGGRARGGEAAGDRAVEVGDAARLRPCGVRMDDEHADGEQRRDGGPTGFGNPSSETILWKEARRVNFILAA